MLSASVDIRVRYQETDKMGVVHHASYFTWFEEARVTLLDELGCPYKDLENDDFFLPVLSCQANFHTPSFFDDRLQVTVKIEKLPVVRVEAKYEIRREHELIATGLTKHAFVSGEGRVIKPPIRFIEIAKGHF